MDLVIQAITMKYFDFSGRARRKEFWLFVVFQMVASIIAGILDASFGLIIEAGLGTFSLILYVGMFIPSIAVAVRRLHDANKSGWIYLIIFIPFIGVIVLLVFLCFKGTDGSNRFGDDPLVGAD